MTLPILARHTQFCFICNTSARIRNLASSLVVDCPYCGPYEIKTSATTVEVKHPDKLQSHLKEEREFGKARPVVYRELFQRMI